MGKNKGEITGLGRFFAFEIGPRFEDSEKLTRRDIRPLRGKFASTLIGFELALFSGTAKMSFLS